jgi:hypothetical protein
MSQRDMQTRLNLLPPLRAVGEGWGGVKHPRGEPE